MAKLSGEDRELIRTLRAAGVLRDVDEHRLDQRNGVILVTCADGDQFYDIFRYQCGTQAEQRSDPRIHSLAWNGGALACAPCSPINKRKHADDIFLDQIADARQLKSIDTVALYAHAPCGAAGINHINLLTVIALQMRAKAKVKTLNQGVTVACFFHVDYGNGTKRTYFLSREQWEWWAEANDVQTIC